VTPPSVTVAVDAMGGDYAPKEIIKGAHLAAEDKELSIILVGQEEQINNELRKLSPCANIRVKHAQDVIEMGEHAARAVKTKQSSSISIAAQLVKEGEACAMVSAGNSGATMSAAMLKIGRIKGVLRPAIAVIIPTLSKPTVLLDAGANAECKPKNLYQFAVMGKAYATKVLDIKSPKIGLLNVGEERGKGGELLQKSYELMGSIEGFVGNIEGNDIPSGKVDVVVCDGFVGNVALKLMEGLASTFFSQIKVVVKSSFIKIIGGVLLASSFRKLKSELDHEEYGGAHLLGINGVCVIGHGRSNAKAVKNAIMVAKRAVLENIVSEISGGI